MSLESIGTLLPRRAPLRAASPSTLSIPSSDFGRRPWTEPFVEELARTNKELFARCVFEDLADEVVMLSYAAEAARLVQDHEFAVQVLERLLEHPSAVVREGAVYGLAGHTALRRTIDVLQSRLAREPSEAVREAIEELLGSL
jgi:HEAT repeat protein